MNMKELILHALCFHQNEVRSELNESIKFRDKTLHTLGNVSSELFGSNFVIDTLTKRDEELTKTIMWVTDTHDIPTDDDPI